MHNRFAIYNRSRAFQLKVVLLLILFAATLAKGQLRTPFKGKEPKPLKAVIFLGLKCPVSQKYAEKIEYIKWKNDANVDFVAIVPGGATGREIRDFKKEFGSTLDFIALSDLKTTHPLTPSVTPEVYLLSSADDLVYHGAIDNWFYEREKYRLEVTEHYLTDAIHAWLKKETVKISTTTAVGTPVIKIK